MIIENTVNVYSEAQIEEVLRQEFQEDEGEMEEAVRTLQEWISSCPHLVNCRQDKEFLRVFYRGCNYSAETFKRKYDLFYTVRSLMPAWFDDWNASSEAVQRILEAGAILPLRGYDKQGRFVLIIRQRFADPAIMTTDDLYKTFIMLFTIAMEQNYQAYCRGYVLISDQEDVTVRHAMMLTPTVLRQHMVVFQDSYPMENQVLIDNSLMFIINMPGLLGKFVTMFRSALDDKYKKIVRPLPRLDTAQILKEEVGEEILPVEMGGRNGTIDEIKEFWIEELPKHQTFLSQQTRYKTDESLRPERPKTSEDVFGSCCVM